MKNNEFLKQLEIQQQMQDAGSGDKKTEEKKPEENVGWIKAQLNKVDEKLSKIPANNFYGFKYGLNINPLITSFKSLENIDPVLTIHNSGDNSFLGKATGSKLLGESTTVLNAKISEGEYTAKYMVGGVIDKVRVVAGPVAGFDKEGAIVGGDVTATFDFRKTPPLFAKKKDGKIKDGTGIKLPKMMEIGFEVQDNFGTDGLDWNLEVGTISTKKNLTVNPNISYGSEGFGGGVNLTYNFGGKDIVKIAKNTAEEATDDITVGSGKKKVSGKDVKNGVEKVQKEAKEAEKKAEERGKEKDKKSEEKSDKKEDESTEKPVTQETGITLQKFTLEALVAARNLMKLEGNQSEELSEVVSKGRIQYQGKDIDLCEQDKALLTKIAADIKLEEEEKRGVDGIVIKEVSKKSEESQIKLLDALIENIDPSKADNKNDKKADKTLGKALKDQALENILKQDPEIKKHIQEWKDDAKGKFAKEASKALEEGNKHKNEAKNVIKGI